MILHIIHIRTKLSLQPTYTGQISVDSNRRIKMLRLPLIHPLQLQMPVSPPFAVFVHVNSEIFGQMRHVKRVL